MPENPSHQSLVTPNPQSLIPSHSSLLSNFRVSPSGVVPFDYVRKGSAGSVGSKGLVAAHKNQKQRGGLKLAVFSYRKPNP